MNLTLPRPSITATDDRDAIKYFEPGETNFPADASGSENDNRAVTAIATKQGPSLVDMARKAMADAARKKQAAIPMNAVQREGSFATADTVVAKPSQGPAGELNKADPVAQPSGPLLATNPDLSQDAHSKLPVADGFAPDDTDATRPEPDLAQVVEAMNKKYAWLSGPGCVYRLADCKVCKPETLRHQYANTAVSVVVGDKPRLQTHYDAWMKSPDRRWHVDVGMFPGSPRITEDNHLNLWKSWGAVASAGDCTPWHQFLDYIFGAASPERKWAEQWIAYPLQHPGAKLVTAMLLWSDAQGVGKTLLGETVGRLYGPHFISITSQELHDQYTGWTQNSLFVLGDELFSTGLRSESNKLKGLITGANVQVHEKYAVRRLCRNQMNFILTSNHADALRLDKDDRRYFVWSINEQPLPQVFYQAFGRWSNSASGLPALMDHLLRVDLSGFDPNAQALRTLARSEMIECDKTDVEQWITDVLSDDYIDNSLHSEIISTTELIARFKVETGGRTTAAAIGLAIKGHSAYAIRRIPMGGGNRGNAVSLRRHDFWRDHDTSEWVAEYAKRSSALS